MSEAANHPISSASQGDMDLVSLYPTLEELAALLPQYEIHRIIGIGGMGAIYLGRQMALDRWVAIKLLPLSAASNASDTQRFIKEARAMAKLVHPHIVAVFDFGQTSEGHLYLVMEYVEGLDLHQRTVAGEITPNRARQVLFQLCDALQFAHDRGVIHRDIKPANILITDRWQVKVADFGLAREMAAQPNADEPEYGTPDYTAPERLIVGAAVDHRADIFALGVVVHEMLTGKTPGNARKEDEKKLPPEFATVITKCTMPDPADRYQKASDIKLALADALASTRKTGPLTETDAADGLSPASAKVSYTPTIVWGLIALTLMVSIGWLVIRNQSQTSATSRSGFVPAQNTTAGAGNLAVFAPPTQEVLSETKPEPASSPLEVAKKEVTAKTEPERTMVVAPPPPTNAKKEAIDGAIVVPPKMDSLPPEQVLPSGGLPYTVPDGEPGEVARLSGHTGLTQVRILSDQRHVISASQDRTVRIWDLETQKVVMSLAPGIKELSFLEVSADGKRAVVASTTSCQLAAIDLEKGEVIAKTTLAKGVPTALAFTSDGRTVLVGSGEINAESNLYQWTPDKRTRLEAIPDVKQMVYDMKLLPATTDNGSAAANMDADGKASGQEPGVLITGAIPLSPDGKSRRIVTSIFRPGSNELEDVVGEWTGGSRFDVSADGKLLSTIALGTIYTLKLPSLEVAAKPRLPSGMPTVVVPVTDGRFIATLWNDKTFRIYEATSNQEVHRAELEQRPINLSISRDGQWAIIGTGRLPSEGQTDAVEANDILIWRLPKLENIKTEENLEEVATKQLANLSEHDPELAKLRDSFAEAIKVTPLEERREARRVQLKKLNAQYVSALQRRKQTTPSLPDQQACQAEIDLIASGEPLPPQDRDSELPVALRELRAIYRKQLTSLEQQEKSDFTSTLKQIDEYFASLRKMRELAKDALGLMRISMVQKSLTPEPLPTLSSSVETTLQMEAATRPAQTCSIVSIPRKPSMPANLPLRLIPENLGPVVAITGGEGHAYVLTPTGEVKGWGAWVRVPGSVVRSGGKSPATLFNVPVTVPTEVADIIKIDSNDQTVMALSADGSIYLWSPAHPLRTIPPSKPIADICAGTSAMGYVLYTDGTIERLPRMTVRYQSPILKAKLEPPENLRSVVRLHYVRDGGFCAVLNDGSCVYWGDDRKPVLPPPPMQNIAYLSFSYAYAIAMQKEGVIGGWGTVAPGNTFRPFRMEPGSVLGSDPAGRVFPVRRQNRTWKLIRNPAFPDKLSEPNIFALEEQLQGCIDALFSQYLVLGLKPM